MGKTTTKKKRRKKAKQKRQKERGEQRQVHESQEVSHQSSAPKQEPVSDDEPRRMDLVSAHVPCDEGGDPNHHLVCPFFELKAWPTPDLVATRDTRAETNFEGLYIVAAALIHDPVDDKQKATCVANLTLPDRTQLWVRFLLPKTHHVFGRWLRKIKEYEARHPKGKMMLLTKPMGPLKVEGTIVGLDVDGIKIGSQRLPDTEQAFVLQDVTVKRM